MLYSLVSLLKRAHNECYILVLMIMFEKKEKSREKWSKELLLAFFIDYHFHAQYDMISSVVFGENSLEEE